MGKNVTKKRPVRKESADALKKFKKKPCSFCLSKSEWIDYKDVELLRRYISDRAKIRARRVTGNCTQHQAEVANAIKVARELALLPYLARPTSSDRERGPGGGRGRSGERRVRNEDVDDTVVSDDVDQDGGSQDALQEGEE
jgi:small subunit ribosomal protein S18